MQNVHEAYEYLLHSQTFQKKGFLCNVFLMAAPEEMDVQPWQFDFYDTQTQHMTSYAVSATHVDLARENEEVFTEGQRAVEELRLADVKIPFPDVFTLLKKKLDARHESPTRYIIVLQHATVPIWNMSALTDAFNLINVKINAQTNEIMDEKLFPMLSWS